MASKASVQGGQPPLVMHVVRRLAVGGMENGLINLINHMPPNRYRHAIVCLTDFTDFRHRIEHAADVPVVALHQNAGHDSRAHVRLWTLIRRLRPAVVHTRNLPSLEHVIPAALAGVPARIHGEHGRDMHDLDGLNRKYNLLRKALRPLIHHHIAVSTDLADWLIRTVGIPAQRVSQIYNGVDVDRFRPRTGPRRPAIPEGFAPEGSVIVGTVGRMEAVKDQVTLVRAFLRLLDTEPDGRRRMRLAMIGDGALLDAARQLLRAAGAEGLAWLPGTRNDVPAIVPALDLFVLPSLREGISNTILEAMASGLPVIATRVGGNPELVEEGRTGLLVPPTNPAAMAEGIRFYLQHPNEIKRHGDTARKKVESHFSMEAMVNGYLAVYDAVLKDRRRTIA